MDFLKNNFCLLLLALLFIGFKSPGGETYITKEAKVSLFSETPMENIRAVSNVGQSVIIAANKQVAFQVPIRSFDFERKMMQEHFNENYMESEKYPLAKFKGVIQENIDFAKDGEYPVTVKGILTVHGVDKARSIPGKIIVKNGIVQVQSAFDVACADHQIKIPTIVFNKIAEVIRVNITASYKTTN